MIQFCSQCNSDQKVEVVERFASHKFRDDVFEVAERVAICTHCGEEIPNDELDSETLKKLGDLYLAKHSMTVQDFKGIRDQYGLSQRQFAKILNWGKATVARYESGNYIPDTAHLSILKVLKSNPSSIQNFYHETKDQFSADEQRKIEEKIASLQSEGIEHVLLKSLALNYQPHEGTIETGYTSFSAQKLFQMILYFSRETVLKTKLMKLLWYADFLMFKRNLVSISGTPYWNFQHGPVPKQHDLVLACMENLNLINVVEDEKDDYVYIKVTASEEFDDSVLDEEELKVLEDVDEFFRTFGSGRISEFAHKEAGWKETAKKQVISYDYADTLQLS